MTRPTTVFFGTPDFAVPCLEAALEVSDVKLVVTQPDRPAGRGMKLTPPPVKVRALEAGIEVVQPKKLRDGVLAERIRGLNVDVAVVVAYGRILPRDLLDAPRLGCVNVHASLLPRFRGAAPINWAIVHGDKQSGVCLMQMEEGLDTGPVLARRATPIGEQETAGELFARLATLGGEIVRDELPRLVAGELEAQPQDDALATLAPIMKKSDGHIDWAKSATEVHQLVRGMTPWPGAHTLLNGQFLKVHVCTVAEGEADGSTLPGTVVRADKHGIEVACGTGVLSIHELQLQGKKRLAAEAFLSGKALKTGDRLGE